MARLTEPAIEERLTGVPDWRRDGDQIVRDLSLEDFAAAMALANRVADAAQDANHHPDILVHGFNQVRLSLTDHSAGGLSDADFELAERIDALAD